MVRRSKSFRAAVRAVPAVVALAAMALGGCRTAPTNPPVPEVGRSLFNGKNLAGWKVTDFGGRGEVRVRDGQIILEVGAGDLTGVTWAGGPLPTMNYEVTLEAMRIDGSDFFCGLTFPVRDSSCSLICGGWGGGLVGISSFDGWDASENETTRFKDFESGRWYRIRVRVTEPRIEAWIDDEQLVDAEPGDRKIDVRLEVDESKPFGLAAYRTRAALREIRVRPLAD